jgi:hypothetical protein
MDGFSRGAEGSKQVRSRARSVHAPATGDASGQRAQEVAVARYIADMAGQLEAMANAARLDLVAYFLAMARAESESAARAADASHDDGVTA